MKLFLLSLAAVAAFAVTAHVSVTAAPIPEAPLIASTAKAVQPLHAEFTYAPETFTGKLMTFLGLSSFALGTVALGGTRTLQQVQLTVTKALPSANANNASDYIDTNTSTPGRIPHVEFGVTVPVLPSLADGKSVTLKIQDSTDGVAFADVADLPAIMATGAGGVGAAAIDRRFKMPLALRQYVRLYAAVENAGGDNTAVSASLGFYF